MRVSRAIYRPGATLRALTVAAIAAVGLGACTEGESRNAPDGAEVVPEPADVAPGPAAVVAEPIVEMRIIPSEVSMRFSVDREVSTDTDTVGSVFTASLVSPINDDLGNVALTAGTPSRWVVTESSTMDGESVLAFGLVSVQIDGVWTDVEATTTDAVLDVDNADSGTETAAKIGIGAAAGAIAGQIIGRDSESTLVGAGVGAAVGTAVALSTRGGHATLPAGAELVVTTDEPVALTR